MDILSSNAMVKTATGEVVECKVILAHVAGGRQIQYIGTDGKVIRTEKLSRSPYKHQVDPEKYKK
ncbi:hypothetical protein [Serpentinicella alkaliphila]|uniref:Uncharacterized protein n=1 Tax=Serpentinicella alkaliphila TaxID=1734049 RepID=A0A4R2TTB6_9FIRM|nr:hypothetical protein [Serpentinicella alkaliphila]QUH25201.1 hypothetical protein HZR23_05115 [Serpentinicella alkaliphila]TCQ07011.1 hypothetical protein EDD79_10027 [Serpentinicella alkaliphila]